MNKQKTNKYRYFKFNKEPWARIYAIHRVNKKNECWAWYNNKWKEVEKWAISDSEISREISEKEAFIELL